MDAERIKELKAWVHLISCAMPSMADKCSDTLRYIGELEAECEQLRLDRIVLARLSLGHYNELGATAAAALRDQVLGEQKGQSDG